MSGADKFAFVVLTPATGRSRRYGLSDRRRIQVLPFDANWRALYEREALLLKDVFDITLVGTFHVGSTSVPKLSAKPTIDILIEVSPGTNIPAVNPRMEALGYICRGECLDAIVPGTPGRFYFVKKRGVDHLFHVHVCASGHRDIEEMRAFRAYLEAHPRVAADYGMLKEHLAAEYAFDNIGYMLGKDAFVRRTLEAATKWFGSA
jgi:GrpB-like predicted nucleotidyltransferase (UPF0157 family)